VRSIDRAIDIILNFIDAPSMTAAEIQKLVKLPRPTLYRMLNALEQRNLLRSSGDPKRYRLDYRVLQLANAWLNSFDIVEVAEGMLRELWENSGETVVLFVPHDAASIITAREMRSPQALCYSRGIGYSAPLGFGASGKVVLAFQPAAVVNAACRKLAAHERSRMQGQLAEIQRDGYYVAAGEVISGAASIAAPIFGADQRIIGAVALLGPYERLAKTALERNKTLVIKTAIRISASAGWSGAPCPKQWLPFAREAGHGPSGTGGVSKRTGR
jgi:DNA-binding IclR family transcriptional regulator